MKLFIIILVVALLAPAAFAQNTYWYNYTNPYSNTKTVQVQGYYNNYGTYVQPYTRTAPDNNPYNNYSSPQPSYSYPSYNGQQASPFVQQPVGGFGR